MYIRVHVVAGAKKEKVEQKAKDLYDIAVKEKALQNRANIRVREIIAELYNSTPKQVRIISGHHRPTKILSIPGVVQ